MLFGIELVPMYAFVDMRPALVGTGHLKPVMSMMHQMSVRYLLSGEPPRVFRAGVNDDMREEKEGLTQAFIFKCFYL